MARYLQPPVARAFILASIVALHVTNAIAACGPNPVICCALSSERSAAKPQAPRFGVQVWPSGLRGQPSTVEQLLALRPRALRFSLGPNWRRQPPLREDMTDATLDAYVEAGLNTAHTDDDIRVMADIARRSQAVLHLVVWEPPPLPAEMRSGQSLEKRALRRPDVPLMGRFLVALLERIAERGLSVGAVELANEPDGNWNIRITPSDYVALVAAVRGEARRRMVALPDIYGPGTSTLTALNAYLSEARTATAIIDSVDVLSMHSWQPDGGPDRFSELEKLGRTLANLDRKPQLAITEYGIARPVPGDRSDRNNLKKRVPETPANTALFASVSARDLLRFYARGITTAIAWEFSDQSWGHSSFGLLDRNAGERPVYGAMRTISERLTTAPKEVVGKASEGLFVTEHDDKAELWSANPTDDPLTIVFVNGYRPRAVPACEDNMGHAGLMFPPSSFTLTSIEQH
jgi:hypothetical protein